MLNWPSIIGIALWALIPGFIARKKDRSFWGYYFLSFVISPLISMIIAICVKDLSYKHDDTTYGTASVPPSLDNAQKPAEKTQSHLGEAIIKDDTISVEKNVIYCKKCGFALADGSEFCSNCGAKVIEDSENT